MSAFMKRTGRRVARLVLKDVELRRQRRTTVRSGPGHAPGHRHLGPPPEVPEPPELIDRARPHNQPWVPTGGLIDRLRRSERRN